MAGRKLLLVLSLVGMTALAPAQAKTSDAPAFGVWLAQWAKNGRQISNERLPCLRAAKGACGGTFSSPVAGARAAQAKGAVDPFSRSPRAERSARLQAAQPRARRVNAPLGGSGAMFQSIGFAAQSTSFMLLSARGNDLFGLDIDAPGAVQPAQVETLAEFVTTVEPTPPADDSLLGDAAGGVGSNAFVALYDFEDDGGAGENQRGFQEVPSLLGAPTALAATDVPEPGSLLLAGAGLLALRLGMGAQGKRQAWLARASR